MRVREHFSLGIRLVDFLILAYCLAYVAVFFGVQSKSAGFELFFGMFWVLVIFRSGYNLFFGFPQPQFKTNWYQYVRFGVYALYTALVIGLYWLIFGVELGLVIGEVKDPYTPLFAINALISGGNVGMFVMAVRSYSRG